MGLYEQIRDIAKSKGYSVNKLEKELGFARSSINKFNKNKPSVEKLQQIADLLEVSLDYLLSNTDETIKEKAPELTTRDERDIAKDLNNIMENLHLAKLDQPAMTVNLWIQRPLLFLKMSWKLPFAD